MNMSDEIFGQSRASCPCESMRLILTGKSFPILGNLPEKRIIAKSFPFLLRLPALYLPCQRYQRRHINDALEVVI
jgi:hypothetical protein